MNPSAASPAPCQPHRPRVLPELPLEMLTAHIVPRHCEKPRHPPSPGSRSSSRSLEKVPSARGAAEGGSHRENSLTQRWDITLRQEISVSTCFYPSQPWTSQNSDSLTPSQSPPAN